LLTALKNGECAVSVEALERSGGEIVRQSPPSKNTFRFEMPKAAAPKITAEDTFIYADP
jgi:hypothetical protein